MTETRRADLTRLHAVVPLRSLATGKLRLGDALDAEERETLLMGMLVHEVQLLAAWPPCEQVHVVTADETVAAAATRLGASSILQTGEGLNDALRIARDVASAAGATALLVLPADLPYVERPALDRLFDAADAALAAGSGRPIVVVAPSDARGGTNALLLAPVDAIEPRFGPASLEAHVRAAALAGASVQLVPDPDLGFDLDTVEDLERLDPERLAALLESGTRGLPIA